jgi:hypothetical protein
MHIVLLMFSFLLSQGTVFWTPSYMELQQGLKYLSPKDSVDAIKLRTSLIMPWCRMINTSFQAIRTTQFCKQHGVAITASPSAATLSASPAVALSIREIVLFWRDLMVFSVQPQVVGAGLVKEVVDAAQSVLRVAFVVVWQQATTLGLGSPSPPTPTPTPVKVRASGGKDRGGGGGSGRSRRHLAVELQSAILAMFAMTGGGGVISSLAIVIITECSSLYFSQVASLTVLLCCYLLLSHAYRYV